MRTAVGLKIIGTEVPVSELLNIIENEDAVQSAIRTVPSLSEAHVCAVLRAATLILSAAEHSAIVDGQTPAQTASGATVVSELLALSRGNGIDDLPRISASILKSLEDYGSATPDNVAMAAALEVGRVGSRIGLKVRDNAVLASALFETLSAGLAAQASDRLIALSREQSQAALKTASIILSASDYVEPL